MTTFNLTQLNDDELRPALFDALSERLEAEAHGDHSIAVVNRMPTVFAVSRRGTLLTISQGTGGLSLLRGDLRCRDRRERLRTFTVGRATIQSSLAITPDRIEGSPEVIFDWIVAMFLAWTASGAESRPAVAEPIHQTRPTRVPAAQEPQPTPRAAPPESRPTARVPPDRSSIREADERRPTSATSTQEHRPAEQAVRESRSAPSDGEAAPPRPGPIRKLTPPLRTYQLLFETARRELEYAKALPASIRVYFLISAGVAVASTAEAFFNDLGSRVMPSWPQLERLDPREKAEVLNIELFNDKPDWSVRPFQSVAAALGFRRALAHAHAETLSFERMQTGDRQQNEVPRTRRTTWQEHCEVETIQQWITDIRFLIEQFSRAHEAD